MVRDTGTGIPSHILSRIFDPFFTTKSVDEGSGLGLAMVFGSAQQLGGAVRVDTVDNEGSTFTVSLRSVEASYDPPSV
ncbi:MAG: signal transduction histidine kinase [Myxococcota bacterium]